MAARSGPHRRRQRAATTNTGTRASAGNLIRTPIPPTPCGHGPAGRDRRSTPRIRHSIPAQRHARSGTSSIRFMPATTAGPSRTRRAVPGPGVNPTLAQAVERPARQQDPGDHHDVEQGDVITHNGQDQCEHVTEQRRADRDVVSRLGDLLPVDRAAVGVERVGDDRAERSSGRAYRRCGPAWQRSPARPRARHQGRSRRPRLAAAACIRAPLAVP